MAINHQKPMRKLFSILIVAIHFHGVCTAQEQESISKFFLPDQSLVSGQVSESTVPQISVNPLPKLETGANAVSLPSYQTQLQPHSSIIDSYQIKLTFSENIREIILAPEHPAGKSIRVQIEYFEQAPNPTMTDSGGEPVGDLPESWLTSPVVQPQMKTVSSSRQYSSKIPEATVDAKRHGALDKLANPSRFQKNPFFHPESNDFGSVTQNALHQTSDEPPFIVVPVDVPVAVPVTMFNPVFLTTEDAGQPSGNPQIQRQMWEMPAAAEILQSSSNSIPALSSQPVRVRFSD